MQMRLRSLESGRTERGGMIRLCHKMRLQGKVQETEHSINHVRDQRRSFSVLRPDSCIVINQHRENRKHVGERRFTITLTLLNSSGIVSSWRTFVRGPVIDPELVGRWTSRLSDSRALSLKIKRFKKGPRRQWSIHTLLEGHWCTLRENEHHASV